MIMISPTDDPNVVGNERPITDPTIYFDRDILSNIYVTPDFQFPRSPDARARAQMESRPNVNVTCHCGHAAELRKEVPNLIHA
jgi:hypothetical protein